MNYKALCKRLIAELREYREEYPSPSEAFGRAVKAIAEMEKETPDDPMLPFYREWLNDEFEEAVKPSFFARFINQDTQQ